MARASSGYAMGGGQVVQSVVIRKEWADLIAEAKARKSEHFNARRFTDEENAFIIEARSGPVVMDWKDIASIIKCHESTARKQWRKLTTK